MIVDSGTVLCFRIRGDNGEDMDLQVRSAGNALNFQLKQYGYIIKESTISLDDIFQTLPLINIKLQSIITSLARKD